METAGGDGLLLSLGCDDVLPVSESGLVEFRFHGGRVFVIHNQQELERPAGMAPVFVSITSK